LAQLDADPIGEVDELLARPVHQLGIGREGDVFRLHRGVDDDAVEIGWFDGAGAGRDRQALLQQGLEALLAHAVAPAGDRGAIQRQGVPEELLAAPKPGKTQTHNSRDVPANQSFLQFFTVDDFGHVLSRPDRLPARFRMLAIRRSYRFHISMTWLCKGMRLWI
jgi:hypothetical protein